MPQNTFNGIGSCNGLVLSDHYLNQCWPRSILSPYAITTHEKINGHRELTVVTAPGPNDHGSVTARWGHSSVTARSQLSHSSVTARSQLNHCIFSMITAQSRLAVTILVTVSSQWAHREQSRWPIFFSWAMLTQIYIVTICHHWGLSMARILQVLFCK